MTRFFLLSSYLRPIIRTNSVAEDLDRSPATAAVSVHPQSFSLRELKTLRLIFFPIHLHLILLRILQLSILISCCVNKGEGNLRFVNFLCYTSVKLRYCFTALLIYCFTVLLL